MPNQTPENINPLVQAYLKSEFAKLGSKNTLTIEDLHGGKPWIADPEHWNYVAAKNATKVRCPLGSYLVTEWATDNLRDQAIYNVQPDLTREGGSIPVTLTFAEQLGANVLLLPMGRGDDGAQ